jgi:hypothetical protein
MTAPHPGSTVDATVVRPRRQISLGTAILAVVAAVAVAGFAGLLANHYGYFDTAPASIAGLVTNEQFEGFRKEVNGKLDVVTEVSQEAKAKSEEAVTTASDAHAAATNLLGQVKSLQEGVDAVVKKAKTFATTAEVTAVNTKVTEVDTRLTTAESEIKQIRNRQAELAAQVAALEELGVAKPAIVGEPATPAEPKVVIDEPPPIEPVTDPAVVALDKIVAACPTANLTIEIVRGMSGIDVERFIQHCSAMYVSVTEEPAPVIKASVTTGGGSGSCAYVLVTINGPAATLEIKAPGKNTIRRSVHSGSNRVCVPRSWFEGRLVEICLKRASQKIQGNSMRTARGNLSRGDTVNPGYPMYFTLG